MSVGAQLEFAFIMFTFFVMAPAIGAAVGYSAWKGKPKNFDREMYWTAFVFTVAVAAFVFVLAQRHGETWPRAVQLHALVCAVTSWAWPLVSESESSREGITHCLISSPSRKNAGR
jgi:cytochrome bd-type quinol oxidase subunit 1